MLQKGLSGNVQANMPQVAGRRYRKIVFDRLDSKLMAGVDREKSANPTLICCPAQF